MITEAIGTVSNCPKERDAVGGGSDRGDKQQKDWPHSGGPLVTHCFCGDLREESIGACIRCTGDPALRDGILGRDIYGRRHQSNAARRRE